jgi:ribosomal protein S2
MKKYVDKKNSSGNYIFNLNDTYNKIKLAARIIASIPNLSEVIVFISFYIRSYVPKLKDKELYINLDNILEP